VEEADGTTDNQEEDDVEDAVKMDDGEQTT
jgi:hypothetical protein